MPVLFGNACSGRFASLWARLLSFVWPKQPSGSLRSAPLRKMEPLPRSPPTHRMGLGLAPASIALDVSFTPRDSISERPQTFLVPSSHGPSGRRERGSRRWDHPLDPSDRKTEKPGRTSPDHSHPCRPLQEGSGRLRVAGTDRSHRSLWQPETPPEVPQDSNPEISRAPCPAGSQDLEPGAFFMLRNRKP